MPLRSLLILVSVLCLVVSAVGWWTVGRAARHRGCGGADSFGIADGCGKLPIGDDLAVGNFFQRRPDAFLKGRSLRRKRYRKAFPFF